jgi:beta-N-acetylhexosaminidase
MTRGGKTHEKRVGQRFMVGFEGFTASADVKALIRDFGVGHVVLFARNVAGPEQVADLVRELQSVARDSGQERPLLVAVDQEGGRVARLKEPWTVWPAARAVGRAGSEETARRMAQALAEELQACGIRYDFAPCLDVDTNPRNPVIGDRSFGDDADLVGRLGAAMIRGFQENGVAACASTSWSRRHGRGSLTCRRSSTPVRASTTGAAALPEGDRAGVATVMASHSRARSTTPAGHTLAEGRRPSAGGDGNRGVVVNDALEMGPQNWTPARSRAGGGWRLRPPAQCSGDAQVEAMEAIRASRRGDPPEAEAADGRVRALKDISRHYQDPDQGARQRPGGEHRAAGRSCAVGAST